MKLFVTPLCSTCFKIKNNVDLKNIEVIDLMEDTPMGEEYNILSVPTLIDDNNNRFEEPFDIVNTIGKFNAKKSNKKKI
jgi:glutaredoxin 2